MATKKHKCWKPWLKLIDGQLTQLLTTSKMILSYFCESSERKTSILILFPLICFIYKKLMPKHVKKKYIFLWQKFADLLYFELYDFLEFSTLELWSFVSLKIWFISFSYSVIFLIMRDNFNFVIIGITKCNSSKYITSTIYKGNLAEYPYIIIFNLH